MDEIDKENPTKALYTNLMQAFLRGNQLLMLSELTRKTHKIDRRARVIFSDGNNSFDNQYRDLQQHIAEMKF